MSYVEVVKDGVTHKFDVELVSAELIGYTALNTNFDVDPPAGSVNRVPILMGTFMVNGTEVKQEIRFAAHRINDVSTSQTSRAKPFLDAIGFDYRNLRQNGVLLPSFGGSSKDPHVQAMASLFGSLHNGGHHKQVGKVIEALANRYNQISSVYGGIVRGTWP